MQRVYIYLYKFNGAWRDYLEITNNFQPTQMFVLLQFSWLHKTSFFFLALFFCQVLKKNMTGNF